MPIEHQYDVKVSYCETLMYEQNKENQIIISGHSLRDTV